jgi:acetyl esterase/lipase
MRYLNRLSLLSILFVVVLAAPAQDPAQPKAPGFFRRPPLPEGTTVQKDLAYGPHERNNLDLYIPKSDKPLPLVVWVHGGGWERGSKNNTGPSMDLLKEGYAVASVNYRLSQHAVFPAQIEDCKSAVRWLRANASKYNLDPDHVGAWGMSAGGHLVALLGTTDDAAFTTSEDNKKVSSRVQAVCDWFGPADFLHWGMVTASDPLAQNPSALSRLLGGLVPSKLDLARQASPVSYAGKSSAPFLIFHGDHDPLVPLQQSEELNDVLKRAGVESSLHVVKGGSHGGPAFMAPEIKQAEFEFFGKHLKSKTAN